MEQSGGYRLSSEASVNIHNECQNGMKMWSLTMSLSLVQHRLVQVFQNQRMMWKWGKKKTPMNDNSMGGNVLLMKETKIQSDLSWQEVNGNSVHLWWAEKHLKYHRPWGGGATTTIDCIRFCSCNSRTWIWSYPGNRLTKIDSWNTEKMLI